MRVTFIEKSQNKAGTTIGLAKLPNETFGVYILKANYAGHVKGGIAYSWCYFIKDVDEKTARELFEKKLKGRAK